MLTEKRTLSDWVMRTWKREGAVLPAFPIVATRLVDLLESPNVDLDDARELISQDPAITAEVIRIANSAIYGGVTPIQNVRGAIMRLGFRETAHVALSAACRSLFAMEDRAEFEVFPEFWGELWTSALVGAHGARIVASEIKMGDADQIFQAAMFRDVGWLVILKIVAAGLVRGRIRNRPSDAALKQVLDRLHPQLGADYLRQNQLPGHVIKVAECHHETDLVFAHDTVQLHVISVVDGLCDQLGISPFSAGEITPNALLSADLLGIEEDRLEYFALQIEGIREQVSDLV